MKEERVLSGMRPTGKLHLGHLSVLENWAALQDKYRCFFMVADWHALSTEYAASAEIPGKIREMVLDWLSAGIDPEKSVIFVQSHVKEHAELHLLFSMITPLSWLERVPTYKEQLQQLGEQGKDINTYGFLGYPLLQAADILLYKATAVPVGEDQLPHLELTREVARRFNFLFGEKVFPEPQALLARVPLLPGTDGRKMSKSYNNYISISASSEELYEKIRNMITDPARVRRHDPGHPEVCTVFTYHRVYNPERVAEIEEECRRAGIGCVECKKILAQRKDELLTPLRERRKEYEGKKGLVQEILQEGARQAREVAAATMDQVRRVMHLSEGEV